jgi:energy-converting hydrogenase Eha subunit C
MLRIELTLALICTFGLLIAGFHGLLAASEYLRVAQIATIGFVIFSVFVYVRLLSLKNKQS